MMTALYPSQAPPSLMVNWFESKLNEKKCSGCRKKGTTKALRILGEFKESTHVLVRCKAKGCSYNDCKIHLIFKKDTVEEPKAESKPTVDLFSFGEPKKEINLFAF